HLRLSPIRAFFPYTTLFRSYLGIDEIHVDGRPRAIFTDLRERKVLDLLPDRLVPTIRDWIVNLRGAHKVKVVCIDMARNYRKVRSEEHTSELQSLRHLVCRL